jgi:hypothetical protein
MTYSKPEVKTLGEATKVIEGKKQTTQQIDPSRVLVAAYDLDD